MLLPILSDYRRLYAHSLARHATPRPSKFQPKGTPARRGTHDVAQSERTPADRAGLGDDLMLGPVTRQGAASLVLLVPYSSLGATLTEGGIERPRRAGLKHARLRMAE